MSLLDQSLPPREAAHSSQAEQVVKKVDEQSTSYRDSIPGAPQPRYSDETYDDAILEEFYDNMIGQAPKNAPEPSASVPALPEKSALRASRLLDSFGLKMGAPQPASLTQTTPHDLYLSSEEDASSSADDFSDYDFESESEESQKSPTRRRSHEDTARVVSVIFSGKPSIVDMSAIRRSISPNSLQARRQSSLESASTQASSAFSTRRMSTSSISSSSVLTAPLPPPPRSSSMLSTLLSKPKPTFLSIDPFAGKSYHDLNGEERGEQDTPRTPKTPTAMFKRTLSLVRKRSKPVLNGTKDNIASASVQTLPIEVVEEAEAKAEPKETDSMAAPTPVTYQDIIKAAKRNAQTTTPAAMSPIPQSPKSPMSPAASSRRVFSGFSMNRRRSIKA
jgi:hypothetical protein